MAEEPRVTGGSRRPDGTIRKEKNIRPGFIPQDEQPVYQSVGTVRRMGVPRCPGLDPDAASGPAGPAKGKSAKRNEKRKLKKQEESADPGPESTSQAPASSQPASAAAATSTSGNNSSSSTSGPAAAAVAAPAGNDPVAVLDKQVKALSKKVRQCISLLDRQKAGEPLNPQEVEKLSKMQVWQEEINDLEHQMAKMRT